MAGNAHGRKKAGQKQLEKKKVRNEREKESDNEIEVESDEEDLEARKRRKVVENFFEASLQSTCSPKQIASQTRPQARAQPTRSQPTQPAQPVQPMMAQPAQVLQPQVLPSHQEELQKMQKELNMV